MEACGRAEHEQYVEFGMGEEQYAIRIQDIHEIIRMQEITQIPSVRSYVKGIISLRGKIVPVISLRSVFRQEEKAYSKSTRIILVHHGEDPVGIIVDRVHKVIAFSNIQPPRNGGRGGRPFHCRDRCRGRQSGRDSQAGSPFAL
ncbi:chemotaxis protein CheW [Paenibacillus sp. P25]|nr:chemotaxis protein CheW [Paenibacillus sp. P25]